MNAAKCLTMSLPGKYVQKNHSSAHALTEWRGKRETRIKHMQWDKFSSGYSDNDNPNRQLPPQFHSLLVLFQSRAFRLTKGGKATPICVMSSQNALFGLGKVSSTLCTFCNFLFFNVLYRVFAGAHRIEKSKWHICETAALRLAQHCHQAWCGCHRQWHRPSKHARDGTTQGATKIPPPLLQIALKKLLEKKKRWLSFLS